MWRLFGTYAKSLSTSWSSFQRKWLGVKTLNAVSLFAGVGGFDLALQRNGIETVAAVEIDPKARAVLAKQFPNTQLFEDVCNVTGKDFTNAGFTPNNGIMVGGFPCQDLSVAGKRAGLAGNRSGLFFEFIRLINETKAQFVILENVPGLLSSNKGRDMGTVIGSLDDIGYSVAWRVLDAQFFGVPQRRRRVFIVGCLGDNWRTPFEILAISQGSAGYIEASESKRKNIATDASVGAGNFELYDFPVEPISPTLNASRAHDTMTFRQRGFGDYADDTNASALKSRDYKDATDLVIDAKPFAFDTYNQTTSEISQTIKAHSANNENIGAVMTEQTVRRLTPTECERLQGFPDGWTEGQADSNRYKQMGNAVAVPVVEWIVKRLVELS